MFGSLGVMEIAIILGVLLLLFGPSQLPKLGRSVGQSIKEFRKVGDEITGAANEVADAVEDIEAEAREAVGAPKKRRGRRARV